MTTEQNAGRTSAISILSSPHGRLRRAQRAIDKRDLQAAVKYGTKTEGFPCPRSGEKRWRYTFADVVFVTDETGRYEITSWPVPGAGLDVELVKITPEIQRAHNNACHLLKDELSSWTSHTVVVVDQSGSMRKMDVAGGATRSDAVWLTLALEFVSLQLETQQATSFDVISIVGMNADCTVLIDKQPTDWLLYNRIIGLLRSAEPKSLGNYLPAFEEAERLLCSNTNGNCALTLLFLSDGKPSDEFRREHGWGGLSYGEKMAQLMRPRIDNLVSMFGRRLVVYTIGFAGPAENFEILRDIASRPSAFGSVGKFQAPSLTPVRCIITCHL